MQDRKMQDLKMQDQIAGHENAGPENGGLLGMRRAFVVRGTEAGEHRADMSKHERRQFRRA